MMPAPHAALLCLSFLLAPALFAGELSPTTPIEDVIDHHIDAELKEDGIVPAEQIDDATLIRRLTLDLVGRIPTLNETNEFVASNDPAKRRKLVDRLINSAGFVRHQATEFDAMLMQGTNASIRRYLLSVLEANKPWDEIFRELMLPPHHDSTAGQDRRGSASEFLKARLADIDKLTTDISVLFFGVNISCARCHDHPLVQDWKQDHFFGMKSFLARTVDIGGLIGEREFGLVKFQTTAGENKKAQMMFLTGKVIDAPGMKELSKDEEKKERDALERAKREKKPLPPPKFSARRQLVEVALQPEGRGFFARSLVNRLWARLFGFGLVHPVDQMHSENPPSHPALLEWLAQDTIAHGYDLRRLIRGMVLSKTYSRSSRWEASGEPPLAKTFAVARLRPLTPIQFATSLRVATADPQQFDKARPEEVEKRLTSLEESARGLASQFEWPGEDFQVSVSEALLFSNSERIQKEILAEGGDRLLGRLKQLKSPREQIDVAVRVILSRPPRAEEAAVLEAYLAKRSDRPAEALQQMVWALLTSAEFRFNH